MLVNNTNKNKLILEKLLLRKLGLMAHTIGLNLSEWDLDNQLYAAFRGSEKLELASRTCVEYDALIDAARAMKIKINPNFLWFYHMEKFIYTK